MDNNFYEEDDFTQFLKDSTEDFKMYPGRRVWHSLYKDMHPSQKWPSFAVCLFLIGSIMYMGVANNNTINKNSAVTITERKVPANSPILAREKNSTFTNGKEVVKNRNTNSTFVNTTVIAAENKLESPMLSGKMMPAPLPQQNELLASTTVSTNEINSRIPSQKIANNTTNLQDQKNTIASRAIDVNTNLNKIPYTISEVLDSKSQRSFVVDAKKLSPATSLVDRSFMDNDIFNNLKSSNLFKKRTSLEYYVTPSVGFRTLKQKTTPPLSSLSSTTPVSVRAPRQAENINDKVTQSYAVNMGAGVGMKYKLTKKIALTTALQFNYTNYVSYANSLQHTEVADLFLMSRAGNFEQQRASAFTNTVNSNSAILNNTTIQFSIPIGLEYTVIKGSKINWKVAGTLQPGIIASGKGYVLSSDNTHYIEDKSLLSNTLLNSSLETTVSYKTNNGVTIFAGPQLRYQLTDTHKSKYNYSERLYNYGLKVGLSRNL